MLSKVKLFDIINIMKRFFSRPLFLVGTVLILIIVGGLFSLGGDEDEKYETAIAGREDLIQEVNITGRVVAAQSVDLAFEKSGTVSLVGADIGDSVYIGQTLVLLENSNEKAQLDQAKASLKIQQATLNGLLRGSREEEIEIQKIKVESAKLSLKEAKQNLVDVLQDAFTKSDDAVRNKVDQFISNSRTNDPQVDFTITNFQLENDIEQGRINMESTLDSWQTSVAGLSINSSLDSYISTAKSNLSKVKNFLDDVSLAVNTVSASANITQATIDGYKADVSIARTSINTAISNLSSAEEKLSNAKSALTLAEQELVLKEAGTSTDNIEAQEAKVEEASANVNKFKSLLSKTVISSPIKGVVTEQEAKVGQIVSANSIIVSLISTKEFEIETNIPEADVVDVSVGDVASVTLDAYGDSVFFEAKVVLINPAETIIEGVSTYKATLQFTQKDERIRSGMTANMDILTDTRENVIAVPVRAVINRDKKRIVRILEDGIVKEVEVEVGTKGSEGTIEIVSGVKEGDEVVVLIKE